MSRRQRFWVVTVVGSLLIILVGWLVLSRLSEEPPPQISGYSVCSLEFREKKSDVRPPAGDRLLGLCNRILKEGYYSEEPPPRPAGDFHFEIGEEILFYSDENKTQLSCRVQFWVYYPKRAKVILGRKAWYCEVPDELYGKVLDEVDRLQLRQGGNRQ